MKQLTKEEAYETLKKYTGNLSYVNELVDMIYKLGYHLLDDLIKNDKLYNKKTDYRIYYNNLERALSDLEVTGES